MNKIFLMPKRSRLVIKKGPVRISNEIWAQILSLPTQPRRFFYFFNA
jgi:hypothetical protein